jgi:hypothetical protein
MNREVSFYIMTTGIFIYLIIFSIFLFIPVNAFLSGALTADQIIGTTLLTIAFFPLAFLTIYKSSKHLNIIKPKRVLPVLLTPYIMTTVFCFL